MIEQLIGIGIALYSVSVIVVTVFVLVAAYYEGRDGLGEFRPGGTTGADDD